MKYISTQKISKPTARKIQIWTIVFLVITFLLIIYSPFEYFFKYIGYSDSNGCSLLTLTGMPCPACGMGRSVQALFTGDSENIFHYNPAGPIPYLSGFLLIVYVFVLSFREKTIKLHSSLLKYWYVPVVLLILLWVANILWGHHY